MSSERKGVRVEDVKAIAWMWHDAEVRSFALMYDGDYACDAVFRCVINFEEDRTALIALGITTLGVELRFRNVGKAQVRWVSPTGANVTIDRWTNPQPYEHHIECHGGCVYNLTCDEVWLFETDEQDRA